MGELLLSPLITNKERTKELALHQLEFTLVESAPLHPPVVAPMSLFRSINSLGKARQEQQLLILGAISEEENSGESDK